MKRIYIGIDPDTVKNGVSTWDGENLNCYKFSFWETFEIISFLKHNNPANLKIVIEAGWKNLKSNWHVSGHGERVSARIGTKVGANHQVGKLFAEMCEYMGLEYELRQPTSSKMTIKMFRKITKYEGKLDQDMVDSAIMIYGLNV